MSELHNLIEDDVFNVINKLGDSLGDWCQCEKCKLDVAAIALNNLKPIYVVTEKGSVLGRANNMNQQFNTDVVLQVTKAIGIVGSNPHHEL